MITDGFGKSITDVYVAIGEKCNFRCKYCINYSDNNGIKFPEEINEDVISVIKTIASNSEETYMLLSCGEPLVYIKEIKYIVNELKDYQIRYKINTNGSLITEELVKYFNDNNFIIDISWDGYNTEFTRGVDIFKNEKLKQNIFRIKDLGIRAVLSTYAYPLETCQAFQELNNEYRKISGKDLRIDIAPVMDNGIENSYLSDFNYDRFYKEMSYICDIGMKLQKNQIQCTVEEYQSKYSITKKVFDSFIYRIIKFIKNKKQNGITIVPCKGINKYICLDLKGNLYICPHSSEKLGTIYDTYEKYLNEIKIWNKPVNNFNEKHCSCCEVFMLCSGGCSLIHDEASRLKYCKARKAMYSSAIKAVNEMLLESNIEIKDLFYEQSESKNSKH